LDLRVGTDVSENYLPPHMEVVFGNCVLTRAVEEHSMSVRSF